MSAQRQAVVVRAIWYVEGVLLVFLGFRFLLALLGANPANAFARFVYATTLPFVAPFFSLFGYTVSYSAARHEAYTLVAMAVYALVGWGIVKLLTISHWGEA